MYVPLISVGCKVVGRRDGCGVGSTVVLFVGINVSHSVLVPPSTVGCIVVGLRVGTVGIIVVVNVVGFTVGHSVVGYKVPFISVGCNVVGDRDGAGVGSTLGLFVINFVGFNIAIQ